MVDTERVVRSSRELGGDRLNTTVGPIRVEVLEGLKRFRVLCEPSDADLSFDLLFEGAMPAFLEPTTFQRHLARVISHTQRITQSGCWSGTLTIDGTAHKVTADRWRGARDHSWGIRPVGEPEAPGIRAAQGQFNGFFHNWAPIQMDGYTILHFISEDGTETRQMDEGVRVYPEESGREVETLLPSRHEIEFFPDTARVKQATLYFTDPSGEEFSVGVEPLQTVYMSAGTGYGPEPDWRHGMYQGPLKVETRSYDLTDPAVLDKISGLNDTLCRYTIGNEVGYGVFETAIRGPYPRYGFKGP